MTDALEITALAINAVGVVVMALILGIVYEYRASSRQPWPSNGRRGHFAAILLILGRVSLLLQLGLFLLSANSVRTPNPPTDRTAVLVVWNLISLGLTAAWLMVFGHFRAIAEYRQRQDDAR